MRTTTVFCVVAAVLSVAPGVAAPPSPRADSLRLTLERAVEIALSPEGNVGLQIAAATIEQAEAVHQHARAGRRPVIESYVSEQNRALNLEAIGIGSNNEQIAPLMFPRRVGPFNTFDARAVARYNLVDLGGRRRQEAAVAGVSVARAQDKRTRDEIAFHVARLYVVALRHKEQVATAEANVELARNLLGFAERNRDAGTGIAIDVTRAKSQLADEEYHLASVLAEQEVASLRLLHAMGVALDTQVELTDSLRRESVAMASADQMTEQARASRSDITAQTERIEKARLDDRAIRSERLPTVALFADFGALNVDANQPVATHAVGFSVKFPLFDGGRRATRRAQVSSKIRREELLEKQLLDEVDLQVRESTRRLRLSESRIRVAAEGLTLAEEELAHARRRYENGVTNSLEITEAQTRLRRAQGNRIEALYAYNVARIDVVEAQGDVRKLLAQ